MGLGGSYRQIAKASRRSVDRTGRASASPFPRAPGGQYGCASARLAAMDDAEMRERIGARIAQARKAEGLTQRDFAELLGVTVRSLQHYEAGTIVPYRHFRRM